MSEVEKDLNQSENIKTQNKKKIKKEEEED